MEIKLNLTQDSHNSNPTDSIVLRKECFSTLAPDVVIVLPDGREIAVDLKECLNAIKLLSEE